MRLLTHSCVSICAAMAIAVIGACHKDHDHHKSNNDASAPVFTIQKPADQQIYNQGDTIWMQGVVTDNELHELSIEIVRDSDAMRLFHDSISIHGLTSYTINRYWKTNVADTTEATVIFRAEDHKPNKTEKKIAITILK